MKKKLLFFLLLSTNFVFAQDNYEIQVYGSQTQAKRSTIFELHSNFTFDGERNIVKGVRPSFHAVHETVEITTGITDNFELGFYLFTNYTSQYGYRIVGSHIRPRIMAPQKWHLPVGLSLSLEFGYQSQQYSTDLWNLEVRPIIDKQMGNLYLAFNPTMGISLQGVDNDATPVFEPNFKAAYNVSKKTTLGLEYYGSLGPVNQFEKAADQSHALYFAYDLAGNKDWELNIGPGWGLTKATEGFVFKILVGRRIQWHHT